MVVKSSLLSCREYTFAVAELNAGFVGQTLNPVVALGGHGTANSVEADVPGSNEPSTEDAWPVQVAEKSGPATVPKYPPTC